ncbi:MAG: tRNA (guanosine(46)-N7)-methyltransferase TrmB, partial [Sediminibacterium sp.]
QFTLTVINLFQLNLLASSDNVYGADAVKPELQIKTHYEGLDIAGSNRIHYCCFKVDIPMPIEKDEILKQLISEQGTD